MLLTRKISRAKWPNENTAESEFSASQVRADAITADLRTRYDTLSFWKCQDADGLGDMVLAVAAGYDRLQPVDLVWLKYDALPDGLQLRDTEGDTKVADLVDSHVDACHLDYKMLGKIAHRIARAVNDLEQYHRYTRAEVRVLLLTAIENGRLDRTQLKDKLRKKLPA